MSLAEGSSIILKGYGTREGNEVPSTFIGRKGDIIIIEAAEANAEGKKPQGKFRIADGRSTQAKPEGGLMIPTDVLKSIVGENGKTNKAAKEKTPRAPAKSKNESGICFCGCGGAAKSRFIQGHDAKAHSLVNQFLRGQLTKEELAKASPYVQEKVTAGGGWNTQTAPARKVKAGAEGADGEKKLFGAAAKAQKARQEREAADAAKAASN